MAGHGQAPRLQVIGLLLVSTAIFGAFVAILGSFTLGRGVRYAVDFDYSGGLQAGAPVKISGVKVGKVDAVEFRGGRLDPATGRRSQVRVVARVDASAQEAIRSDAEFFVNTAGVLGEQYLEIAPGHAELPPLAPGSTVRGVDPPRTDLIVARLYEFLDSVTSLLHDDRETIREVLRAGSSMVRTVDAILLENRADIGRLLRDVDRFTVEAGQLAAEVRRGVGDGGSIARTLANVEAISREVRGEVGPVVARARRALDAVSGAASVIAPEDRKRVEAALDHLVRISERVDRVSEDLAVLVADTRRGRGTAGALLVEPQVYDDLRELVRELKRHPWKLFWRE